MENRQQQRGSAPMPAAQDWWKWLLTVILLGGVAWVIYGPALNTPFVFDDAASVEHNPSIRNLWPLIGPAGQETPLWPQGYYPTSGRPLVNLTFAINYYFGQFNTRGYHEFNLVVHVLSALLLAAIVRRTLSLDFFQGRFQGAAWPLSVAVALAWVVHPLQTEAVIYVTQRTELMFALFCLATLYSSIRYWSADSPAGKNLWLILATLANLAGMASKEVMVVTPVIALLYERTFVAGSFSRALERSWPLYAGLAAGWALLLILNFHGPRSDVAGFNHEISALVWWWTQTKILWMYLKLVLWPWPLVIHYGAPYVNTFVEALPWLALSGAFAATTVILLWRRSSVGFLFACVWLMLSPTLIIPIVTEAAAERRMYVPLAALLSLLIVGAYWLVSCILKKAMGRTTSDRMIVGAALAAVLSIVVAVSVVSGFVDSRRLQSYESEARLWQDTLVDQPDNPWAHNNFGEALYREGKYAEAIEQFQEAVQLKPDYADVHCNLGALLYTRGQYQEGIEHCEMAVKLKPKFAQAESNLGYGLLNTGRAEEAVSHFRKAIEIDPELTVVHYNLGRALSVLNRPAEAIPSLREALRLEPNYFEADNDLGLALLRLNQYEEGLKHFQHAVLVSPTFAEGQNNVGVALIRLGRPAEAQGPLEKAVQLAPGYIEAWANLATVYITLGHPDAAIAAAEKGLALAHGKGDADLARQIEARLARYRAAAANSSPPAEPIPEPALPPNSP